MGGSYAPQGPLIRCSPDESSELRRSAVVCHEGIATSLMHRLGQRPPSVQLHCQCRYSSCQHWLLPTSIGCSESLSADSGDYWSSLPPASIPGSFLWGPGSQKPFHKSFQSKSTSVSLSRQATDTLAKPMIEEVQLWSTHVSTQTQHCIVCLCSPGLATETLQHKTLLDKG